MKKDFFRTITFTFSVVGLLLLVFPVAAQITQFDDCSRLNIQCGEGGSVDYIIQVITRVVNVFLAIVAIIAVIFVIWGGVQYIISGGDEGKAESAKKTILYAIVGIIIIGLSAVVVNFIVGAIQGRV